MLKVLRQPPPASHRLQQRLANSKVETDLASWRLPEPG
jgi:hypothetical protein